jgi:hypothetical protein
VTQLRNVLIKQEDGIVKQELLFAFGVQRKVAVTFHQFFRDVVVDAGSGEEAKRKHWVNYVAFN